LTLGNFSTLFWRRKASYNEIPGVKENQA